jgi:hypothetical protein
LIDAISIARVERTERNRFRHNAGLNESSCGPAIAIDQPRLFVRDDFIANVRPALPASAAPWPSARATGPIVGGAPRAL